MRATDLNIDKLYHGDNFGTTELNPKWMIHDDSNNQEGVGIYFTPNKNNALGYGKKICSINRHDLRNIVNSREYTEDLVKPNAAINFMNYLLKSNEDFWYKISDYSGVSGPEDVTLENLRETFDIMKNSEIRNWQIELAMAMEINEENNYIFVNGWNRFIKIDAMFDTTTQYYSVINTNIKVTPENF